MNRKQNWIEKVSDFISGKGFYFVVLICVAAIALSGYYLVQGMRGALEGAEDNLPVSGSAAIKDGPSAAPSPAPSSSMPRSSPRPSPSPSPVPTATPAPTATPEPVPTATPVPTPEPTPAALVFTWPVKGSVIASFSIEALAYDETMGDWRIHDGLDISADLGTQVMATANGAVSAVYQDDLMGTVVVVDHGGGLTSLYANLSETPTVAVGDKVSTATVLGTVGGTAAAERGRDTHLHFSMYQSDLPIDPADYLP